MVENKVTIPYQIRGIKPSEYKKGYVEVTLEPVDAIDFNQDDENFHPPIRITGIGPDGSPFPPEFQNQLTQILKSAMPPFFRGEKRGDPRRIIHLESEIDFIARNWKYGDIINVTLEKVKSAEDVEQVTE
ncbi:MAG: hypothetical protein DRJ64_07130 [Thermoprotei archaeon]|nr:MAG: hypothetical protein DRJ64_07130 [Thermoprotei archaeon]